MSPESVREALRKAGGDRRADVSLSKLIQVGVYVATIAWLIASISAKVDTLNAGQAEIKSLIISMQGQIVGNTGDIRMLKDHEELREQRRLDGITDRSR